MVLINQQILANSIVISVLDKLGRIYVLNVVFNTKDY